jgi:hypothetical protein
MEVGVSGLNLEAAATNVREELLLGRETPYWTFSSVIYIWEFSKIS